MKKVIAFLLFASLFSCSENRADQQPKPLILDKEAGWGADIRLSVTDISETDTATFYKAVSIYNGKNLGFLLSVPKEKKESKGFGKGISMKSLGEESDNLLQVLSQLYNVQLDTKRKFTKSSSLSYINLQEFARSLQRQESRSHAVSSEYKLFFENEDDYAELYLNINTEEGWIELAEKDEGYRAALIKILSE